MTMLDEDTIKPYCPSLLHGKSDLKALSQILREALGLSLSDEKVRKATQRIFPYFVDKSFQMPSWYSRFEAEY